MHRLLVTISMTIASRIRPAASSARLSEPAGRWLLVVTSLGSGLVLLEATVVNVALPALGTDLGASMVGLQWIVNAFTLTLSAFILTGGGIGDRFGRRRVYLLGVAWFGAASLLCGAAPTESWLIAGRALQGIGGALIVPGSLALIQSVFHPDDRNRAIGWWAGMSGVAGAAGPFVGGVLIDTAGWRWVFLINVPLAAAIAALLIVHVPEQRERAEASRFDIWGALLAATALGAIAYAMTQSSQRIGTVVGVTGLVVLIAFLVVEHRSRTPMLPLRLFRSRLFSTANVASFFAYGGLAGMFFLLPIQLQITAGYSAAAAGLALIPMTVLTLTLSPFGGGLASRLGYRMPLLAGSLVSAVALLWATRIGAGASYLLDVLPVVVLTGIGIPLFTPPITAAVLSSVPAGRAGAASAVNNGVARVAGLFAVAALPVLVGLPQDVAGDTAALDRGFDQGMLICAGLFLVGGVTTWIGFRSSPRPNRWPEESP